jgi:SAM-dependent methyltransferase
LYKNFLFEFLNPSFFWDRSQMIETIKNIVKKWKEGTEYLNYGRDIISSWAVQYIKDKHIYQKQKEFVIFDHGCGHGDDLELIKNNVQEDPELKNVVLHLYGIENYAPFVEECKAKGIDVFSIDLEKEVYPLEDQSVDIIITNQVMEHTKEIFWIMEQFTRLLKPEGILIIGVPNLASLHNRILLLLGEQPTAQQSLGPHVRGFTLPDLKRFVEVQGFFEFLERKGSNFYPFPPSISKILANLFPSLAWGLFAKFRRTNKQGSFLDYLKENFLETPYYGSPQNPANTNRKIKNFSNKRKIK